MPFFVNAHINAHMKIIEDFCHALTRTRKWCAQTLSHVTRSCVCMKQGAHIYHCLTNCVKRSHTDVRSQMLMLHGWNLTYTVCTAPCVHERVALLVCVQLSSRRWCHRSHTRYRYIGFCMTWFFCSAKIDKELCFCFFYFAFSQKTQNQWQTFVSKPLAPQIINSLRTAGKVCAPLAATHSKPMTMYVY